MGATDKWKEASTLQNKVMRFILKVKGRTNISFMNGELNWLSLSGRRNMMRLRYWRKIILMKKTRSTKRAYQEEIKRGRINSWAHQTKRTLKKYNMEKYWKQQLPILTEEEALWNNTRLNSSKLRIYNSLKTKKNWDDILEEQDILAKAITLRLKAGANFLQIDKGRQNKTERKERICQGCKEQIEDEEHFLLNCKKYETIRGKMLCSQIGQKK